MGDSRHVGDRQADGARATKRSRVPRWARLCTFFGAVLVLLSGGVLIASEVLIARYEGAVGKADLFGDEAAAARERKSDIKGPLNILLVGIDPRTAEARPLADSIMIVHVSEGLDHAYLFSLPRDLIVDIPSFGDTYHGGTDRLNAAMSHGSVVPGKLPDAARGFQLLSTTISNYTGIKRFDAGAIINFSGFKKIVDAMGGVDLYVDERTKSEHLQPDGSRRPGNPRGGYVGPQKVYEVGQHHLKGWEALDFVRQRYGLKGTDYGRQRHQQQFLRAMVNQALSRDVVTNPIKLDSVLRAAGKSLIFSGRGHSIADFGFALRGIRSDSITMIKLPGGGVMQGGKYQGERLQPIAQQFFAQVVAGTVDSFVLSHPELINKEK